MLTVQPKARIVTRILETEKGTVRAYFLVAEYNGKILARCIKTECISDCESFESETILALPGAISASPLPQDHHIIGESVLSPYNFCDFCTNQKTRGPNFAY